MKFDIFPNSKKTLQNIFIILLVITSFLGGVLVAKWYFDGLVGQKNEEYSKELTVLQEKITTKEIEHTKEVSLLKSEYERQLKQKVVTEVSKDGSSKQVIETESNESQIVIKEVIKEVEVEKIVYVDRVVEVEKVIIVNSIKRWSLGFAIEPQISLPYFNNFSLELGYSLSESFEVFVGYNNNLEFSSPQYLLGLRFKF